MGFRYRKRIKLGKHIALNISKSIRRNQMDGHIMLCINYTILVDLLVNNSATLQLLISCQT